MNEGFPYEDINLVNKRRKTIDFPLKLCTSNIQKITEEICVK